MSSTQTGGVPPLGIARGERAASARVDSTPSRDGNVAGEQAPRLRGGTARHRLLLFCTTAAQRCDARKPVLDSQHVHKMKVVMQRTFYRIDPAPKSNDFYHHRIKRLPLAAL